MVATGQGKSGKFKVRKSQAILCWVRKILDFEKSQDNTGKSLESQGNLTFSCHKRCDTANSNSLRVTIPWNNVHTTNIWSRLGFCDFVSFSGIGIELDNLSGHRTLITFCKLIANYMYIAHNKFSWLFRQHVRENETLSQGKVRAFWKLLWVATMIKINKAKKNAI